MVASLFNCFSPIILFLSLLLVVFLLKFIINVIMALQLSSYCPTKKQKCPTPIPIPSKHIPLIITIIHCCKSLLPAPNWTQTSPLSLPNRKHRVDVPHGTQWWMETSHIQLRFLAFGVITIGNWRSHSHKAKHLLTILRGKERNFYWSSMRSYNGIYGGGEGNLAHWGLDMISLLI